MEEKDREIWVGGDRIYLGEEGIIYITVVGEKDEKIAVYFRDAFIKIANMVEGEVGLLIDANKAGQPSSKAREIIQEGVLKHEKTRKVAIFGTNPVIKMVASFLMGAIRKKYMRFFKTKEEALVWLKE